MNLFLVNLMVFGHDLQSITIQILLLIEHAHPIMGRAVLFAYTVVWATLYCLWIPGLARSVAHFPCDDHIFLIQL